ncbi:metallophosphoesterase [Dactylosporangium sp. NPDC049525]|uniref:metallophosphoesterase n=1 Tax=Dactylosporangium sp. NPDC049525 TaxID=3154730 RepID=UPI003441D53E
MATIAVIGDVGGCAAQLAAALERLDADAGDTVVIQVGDLVDRGPDSSGVLDLVQLRIDTAPRRWIQLAGNHEAQYTGGMTFWPERLGDADAERLRSWWLRDRMRVAVAVRTAAGEELLVTHAGLTVAAWRELGGPVTAATAADLLNTRPEPLLWADHGPLWAEHVAASWLEEREPMPFSQVHGHSSIVDHYRRAWRCAERIRQRSTVDWAARHTTTRVSGARIIGVDPKHGRHGAPAWAPLLLPGAELL